jgi:hypothetical protein
MKKRETPSALTRFLEKESAALAKRKIDLTEQILGEDHPDIGVYVVTFPKSAWTLFKNEGIETSEYPEHIPFAMLHDEEAGQMNCFLAFNCASSGVDVWDAMNGEGFFPVAKSLEDFKRLLIP